MVQIFALLVHLASLVQRLVQLAYRFANSVRLDNILPLMIVGALIAQLDTMAILVVLAKLVALENTMKQLAQLANQLAKIVLLVHFKILQDKVAARIVWQVDTQIKQA